MVYVRAHIGIAREHPRLKRSEEASMVKDNDATNLTPARREFITAGFASVTLAAASGLASAAAPAADASAPNAAAFGSVRALVFDVFGTVVDWRSSIIREGELLGK